ncbi:hypothetical protein [Neobacillus niacini]
MLRYKTSTGGTGLIAKIISGVFLKFSTCHYFP